MNKRDKELIITMLYYYGGEFCMNDEERGAYERLKERGDKDE